MLSTLGLMTLGPTGCAAPSSKEEGRPGSELAKASPADASGVVSGEGKVEGSTKGPAGDQADEGPGAKAEPAPPPEPAWQPRPEDRVTPQQRLDRPEALSYFFDRLARIDDGAEEVVRVVHLGASMIGADDLPSVLRTRFQTRFGDGGAGLVLLQRYMPNYLHHWVELDADGWDHCYIAYLCKKDGFYGLGGTTFWSDGGARTRISTRDHELGGKVSKYEVWYAADTRGGRLEVRVDKGEPEVIETRGEALEDRYHPIDVEAGPHQIRLRALGGGRVRGYGVVLETDGPGITWEQFSMLGAFTKRMLAWDPEHIAGQIAHRDPDLVVFTYGGNDTRRVATGKLGHEQYVEEYSEAVKRVRAGKPEMSCLITAMIDRAKSLEFDIKAEHVELIVAAQREVAEKTGCAFFDSFTAMGGAGSMVEWRKKKPPLASGDLKHLNHRGREILGGWMFDAVIDAYVAHRTGTRAAPSEGG
ncbi:GDSL-type esterase/lipase family protein [Paraliomyxa miuraensis]|uniref:GDSL-type esterase/lipase family protein n=1 Tax=Paraliomyxa miuraensis TaxID=376150 RepID=UPI00224EC5B5|nr:GDSL-type esterase/lipase family protein [Paraliomyxa miuraensis]MCX4243417.1 GDSL-type esterase/lipase family protein [Paraliomyxa miuraensis]